MLLHDINLSAGTVSYINSVNSAVSLGSQSSQVDQVGRRRMLLASGPSAQGWKMAFSGSPTDGAAYWSAGSMYAFTNSLTLPVDPLVGARVRYVRPRIQNELPNGQLTDAKTGPEYAEITMRFRGLRSADLQQLERLADAGVCCLDLGDSLAPWNVWPVRCAMKTIDRAMSRATQDEVELICREVVA